MDEFAQREFAALRATIQSRGNLKLCLLLASIVAWAAVLALTVVWLPSALASAMPLIVLVAGFEAVRSAHLGAERIGRYLQVFFEETRGGSAATAPAWERTAMALSPTAPGAGGHPYFLPVYLMAAVVNFTGVFFLRGDALAIAPGAVTVSAVLHVAFASWLLYCDQGMRRQRRVELERCRALRDGSGAGAGIGPAGAVEPGASR
jgi:hypothetical protein